jgi:plastocyanin
MKSKTLLLLWFVSISMAGFSTIRTITNVSNEFSPATITITLGDTVNFDIASSHDAREVSFATWQDNGITALAGGFQTSLGGGQVLPDKLGLGTHYYVCTIHAANGMKGTIIVQNATGITENESDPTISIFPNPSADFITVKANADKPGSTYFIADQTGRQVMTGKLSDEISIINLNRLTAGVYLFQFGELSKQTYKVIKQ